MTAAALISEWHHFCHLFYFFANVSFVIDRFMDGILMDLFVIMEVAGVAGLMTKCVTR